MRVKSRSRTAAFAGGALVQAASRVDAKARRIAAHLLEVGLQDVERVDGSYSVLGARGRTVSHAEVVATPGRHECRPTRAPAPR